MPSNESGLHNTMLHARDGRMREHVHGCTGVRGKCFIYCTCCCLQRTVRQSENPTLYLRVYVLGDPRVPQICCSYDALQGRTACILPSYYCNSHLKHHHHCRRGPRQGAVPLYTYHLSTFSSTSPTVSKSTAKISRGRIMSNTSVKPSSGTLARSGQQAKHECSMWVRDVLLLQPKHASSARYSCCGVLVARAGVRCSVVV